ncbi:AAA family ATPase [Endozoicomonas sp. ONNA2]|uniref:AAA family ATPase n=1 Tax=Endozoicomonas sp. ONNA2 TaxID=2828741 RepID=UPI0021483799|nr:AAA family ATPase [Endozoicomonas sp. ONNA2]
MINSSPTHKTTTNVSIDCQVPSTENSGPLPKVGISATEGNFDGSEPPPVSITKRPIKPLSESDIAETTAKVIEAANNELQSVKEELVICDEKVELFKQDLIQIRLWENEIYRTFPKGMLLSSAPGHGKTVFMQAIGNMITEGDRERIQFLTGADLLQGLNNDRMECEYFAKAKLAYENYLKGLQPRRCFVYCIDEIDNAFMQDLYFRASKEQEACRNLLQSLLDGGKLTLPNIYIIGTTNQPFKHFHPALLRAGRLGNHISFNELSLENIKKLIKLYLKAHPTIRVEDNVLPLVAALYYERLTPADIKEQIDKIATWSITETFSTVLENGEQTIDTIDIPFAFFKSMLYPNWKTNEVFKAQLRQLRRVYPYIRGLSYASSQMEKALSLLTDIANRQDVGKFSIILLQGKAGSGKTAFLHELLQRFKAGDKEYSVDHYCVIKSMLPSYHKGDYITSIDLSETSTRNMVGSIVQHYSTILALDDGEWLAGADLLPCTGAGNQQHDPSIFINDWNQTENRHKKSNTILLVTFDGEKLLQKIESSRSAGLITENEFKAATGLNGVVEGMINLPEFFEEENDVEHLIGNFVVDEPAKITEAMKGKKLPIKEFISLIISSKRNGTVNADRFQKLLDLNYPGRLELQYIN